MTNKCLAEVQGTFGFGPEAAYGLEPHAGPSTAYPVAHTYPYTIPTTMLTYEGESLINFQSNLVTHLSRLDPPAPMQPYVPPRYEVQEAWTMTPAMVQPEYPPLGKTLDPFLFVFDAALIIILQRGGVRSRWLRLLSSIPST